MVFSEPVPTSPISALLRRAFIALGISAVLVVLGLLFSGDRAAAAEPDEGPPVAEPRDAGAEPVDDLLGSASEPLDPIVEPSREPSVEPDAERIVEPVVGLEPVGKPILGLETMKGLEPTAIALPSAVEAVAEGFDLATDPHATFSRPFAGPRAPTSTSTAWESTALAQGAVPSFPTLPGPGPLESLANAAASGACPLLDQRVGFLPGAPTSTLHAPPGDERPPAPPTSASASTPD